MRRSYIWFAVAAAWTLDFLLALSHRKHLQAALTAFFACCFLAAALAYRKREQKTQR